LIVAIDGPSGAGKSTLSKALARKTGYINIDTGAMYRSVALLVDRQRVDVADEEALRQLCSNLRIEFVRDAEQERVIVNGEDVSMAIRTPEVSLLTTKVAASRVVREAMVDLQRRMGQTGGVILEGRDIGTVVFPQAEVKLFLSATAEERGRRRYDELLARGIAVDLQQTIIEIKARDAADSAREHGPLRRADDAADIDSTKLTIDEVLAEMLKIIAERRQAFSE
ncbi:MAG: (d)CMP kinase, partial [Desulfuromonadales bacterium]|nr:(d)CMP kinase [Desulfuromonadales bacterium]